MLCYADCVALNPLCDGILVLLLLTRGLSKKSAFIFRITKILFVRIMKEKLRYAIYNRQAIDGDDTATDVAVASMGWEEDSQ
jgi:hypothetical protein